MILLREKVMQPRNNRKIMIAVLVALLLMRFLVVPVFDWQAGKIAIITSNENFSIKQIKNDTPIINKPSLSNINIYHNTFNTSNNNSNYSFC